MEREETRADKLNKTQKMRRQPNKHTKKEDHKKKKARKGKTLSRI
jgi:hypothetical protein